MAGADDPPTARRRTTFAKRTQPENINDFSY
jgi:hypothetical protein